MYQGGGRRHASFKVRSNPFVVPVCANDATSSKSTVIGRDVADVNAQTACGCVVSACGSVRCKTCKHISQGSNFPSNVTKKSYEVISHGTSMTCSSENVVYLKTCN